MFSPPRSNEGGEDRCAGFRLSHLGPRSFDRVEIDAESYSAQGACGDQLSGLRAYLYQVEARLVDGEQDLYGDT